MDKRKDHGAVDDPSLNYQFHKLDTIIFLVGKICSHSTSATRSYSRLAGRLADEIRSAKFENFKFIYWMKYLSFCYF